MISEGAVGPVAERFRGYHGALAALPGLAGLSVRLAGPTRPAPVRHPRSRPHDPSLDPARLPPDPGCHDALDPLPGGHAPADPLHPPVPRAPDALRRGRGQGADRRPPAARADDGRLDARLVPRPRVRPERRGPGCPLARRHPPARPEGPQEPLEGRARRAAPDEFDAVVPRLLPGDVGPGQLGRCRLRPDQRRPDVPDARRRPRPAPARGHAGTAARAGRTASPACPTPRAVPLTITSPPTSTRSSIARSTPATRPSTSSRSTASRTFSSTRARGASGTAPDRPATSRRSSAPQRDFWGPLPYDKYVFFNLLTESGGGLEHKNSTVLMASRWATRTRPAYLGWLNLVCHEFFHTWNVKRLRPVELGPFDYENEVDTRSLWIAEGITSYYDRLLVRRAGLCTRRRVPGRRPALARLRRRRSRRTTSSGFRDARPAGPAAGGFVVRRLDQVLPPRREHAEHRHQLLHQGGRRRLPARRRRSARATDGGKSLDDVMRLAYDRYSGERGFTPEQFRATIEEVAGNRPRRPLRPRPRIDRGAGLRRGPRLVRPPLRREQGGLE